VAIFEAGLKKEKIEEGVLFLIKKITSMLNPVKKTIVQN